jgi:WD40 repeat protein
VARVFVSHASDDLGVALAVQDWLRRERHQVFLDRDLDSGIRVGDVWKQRLHRELRAADAVACIVSAASLRSQWCSAEIAMADILGIRLLPLRAETGVTSDLLADRQYVDYTDDAQWGDKLAGALRGVDAAGGLGWPDERSPYPGLRPFDVGMARVFCGRDEETRRLARRLRSFGERPDGALILVIGPSGCGKSSLVRAGVLGRLAGEPGWENWEMVSPFLPGSDPVGALAKALAATANRVGRHDWTIAGVRTMLDHENGLDGLADELLVAGRGPARDRLLLVIDQGEELFTLSDPAGRGRLATLLRRAVTGSVRVVVTLRSEFQDQLLALPELAGLVDAFVLQPLDRDMLRVVVEEPARLAGLTVDRELVDRLVADTGAGDALPLLAFTLNQLAEGLTRGDTLSIDKYDRLGGVRGALAHRADAALATAVTVSGLTREQVLAGLVRLADLDRAGRRTRRRVYRRSLPEPLEAALGVFVEKRLLGTDSGTRGRWIGVAHEALLTGWPPLDAAITERAAALQAARSVEQAAAEWRAGAAAEHFLWDANRLAVTEETLGLSATADDPALPPAEQAVDLGADGHAFLAATRRRVAAERLRKRRRLRRVTAVLSVLFSLAVAAAALAGWQRSDAVAARHLAERQRNLETSRKFVQEALVLRDSRPRTSAALSLLAFDLAPDLPEAGNSLLSVQATYYNATLTQNMGPVHSVAVSPDGRLLATAQHDDAVAVWKMPDRTPLPPLRTDSPVYDVAVSPDGAMMAGACQNGDIVVWDARTLTKIAELSARPDSADSPVNGVSFSPDGGVLAGAGQDGTVGLWDTRTRRKIKDLVGGSGPAGPVDGVAFSPTDGDVLAATANAADGTAGITFWDPESRTGKTVVSDVGLVTAVAFSPDGRRLAAGSETGAVTVWDTKSPTATAADTTFADQIRALAFSPDGRTLAAGTDDGAVRLWDTAADPRSLRLLTSLTGPTDSVLGLAFTPDGRTLAGAGADAVVGLWSVSGAPDRNLPEIRNAAVFASSRRLATAGRDRTPLLWKTEGGDFAPVLAAPLPKPPPPGLPQRSGTTQTYGMTVGADGRALAAPAADGPPTVWDLGSYRARTLPGSHQRRIRAVAFSPDGAFLVTASGSPAGELDLWDAKTLQPVRPSPSARSGAVNAVALSPSPPGRDAVVATGGGDGIAAVSDLHGSPPHVLPAEAGKPVLALAFSPDGTMLAGGNENGAVQLWTTGSRRPTWTPSPLEAPAEPGRPVTAVSFSGDGTTLASASADGLVRLWDLGSGRLTATLSGRAGTTSAAFPPDGDSRILATADQDGTPVLWKTDPSQVARRLCAGPPLLTSAEWSEHLPNEPHRRVC